MKELLKILILEDSEADAEIVQRLLQREKLHCEFSVAANKETYMQALDRFYPDIILSDHSLPQFDSADALVIAREQFPGIPFIMVTGTASEEFAAEIIKLGADDYVLKDRMGRLPAVIIKTIQRRKSEKEKLEAEKRIVQSEINLRAIFENTSEGFLLLDRDAVIMAFNSKASAYSFFSRQPEFQIGQSIYDFIEDSRKEFVQEIIEKVLNGESIQYDRSYETGNGNIVWIDFSATPVIESGQVKALCIAGRDITEKKNVEQEREFERSNLKALINNTNDLMWSVSTDFKLITSNEAFDNMVKAISGDNIVKGNDVLSIGFKREQISRFRKYYEQAFSGESFTEIEHVDFPDEFWSEISFYPIYNAGIVIGAACFSRDITQRKKAEKEINDYKNALDQSSIVSITDQKGIIKYVNDNFCKISGYSASELIGQDHRMINPRYHPDNYIENMWAMISKGNIWRGEFCNEAKNTSLYWVDATIIPFLDSKGNPVQYLAITNDVTGKKRMEKDLIKQKIEEQKKIARAIIKAQEKERNYIGQELHDNINQILATVKMFLGTASKKNEDIKELIKYPLELLDSSIEGIRVLSHELVTTLKDIDLQIMIRDLLNNFGQNTSVKTKFTYLESSGSFSDDLKLNIYRIIQEQLNNIMKHAAAKNVTVSVKVDNNIIMIVIADDGKGFDVSKKRKGIGISNIINRIESYNGKVEILSTPGNGCLVNIEVPV